jgi:hypothetical protein
MRPEDRSMTGKSWFAWAAQQRDEAERDLANAKLVIGSLIGIICTQQLRINELEQEK